MSGDTPALVAGPPAKNLPTVGLRDGAGGALAFRRDQLGFLAAGLARHGPIFRFRLLGLPVVLVNHPDHVRHVLVDQAERYDKDVILFRLVAAALRNGLIATPDMALWRRQRRLMAPHFTPRTVSSFVRTITDETEQTLESWERAGRIGDVLDVTAELGRLALRIVARSLFGADLSEVDERFERAFGEASDIFSAIFRFPFPPLKVPTPRHRRLRRAIAELDGIVTGIVEKRRREGVVPGGRSDLLGCS
ncbi:cytochrome P450 [Streptomyces sp. NPDC001537]